HTGVGQTNVYSIFSLRRLMLQSRTLQKSLLATLALVTMICSSSIVDFSTATDTTPEERGLANLQHKAYGPPLMNKKILFEILPKAWEPEWQAKIDPSDPDSIRKVAFERYGFSDATWDNQGAPLQFTSNQVGMWAQTCMLCHGGRVPVTGESKIGM